MNTELVVLGGGLVLLAMLLFFWIPGVGIILAVAGVSIAFIGAVMPSIARGGRGFTVAGVAVALVGVVVIPFIDPILGTMMLLVGSALAVASPLMAGMAKKRSHLP